MKHSKLLKLSLIAAALVFLAGCAAQPQPQATAVPATQAPTEAPATDVPATDVPATDVPATDVPETDAPAAEEPAPDVQALVAAALAEGRPVLLSLEELALFNGKDGKPAFVAVDGIIYDVSASAAWKNGDHNSFEAGRDLTKEIKEVSPHGVGKLENVVEIGRVKVFLTLEQLAQFNGKDGQPAYVAVDGIIYDVTASAAWKNGDHNSFEAGHDLTKEIKEVSPHGVGKLENVVEIGVLVP